MPERLLLIGFCLGYLVLLSAVGAAPAAVLARQFRGWPLAAPVVGFAAAAAVLTTASLLMSMRTAAWALLLPGAIASLAIAVALIRRGAVAIDGRELALPILVMVLGAALALSPGVARDTVGPAGLAVYDGLGYVQADAWLQEHSVLDSVPIADRDDLSAVYGYALVQHNYRFGVSAVNGAVASLFGISPDATSLALLSALFALVPGTIWIMARRLGATRLASVVGSLFGISPAVMLMVADSALANLAALVLAPLSVLVLADVALRTRAFREACLCGILLAGLAAVYPEFLPPVGATFVLGAIVLVVHRVIKGQPILPWLGGLTGPLLVVGVTALLVAPFGLRRALGYLSTLAGDESLTTGLPERFLAWESSAVWAFGVFHLYQFQRFDALSEMKKFAAIGLSLALIALVLSPLVFGARPQTAFVVVPAVVALTLGWSSYAKYQGGHCEYCFWKSATYLLPFLGVGVALGLTSIIRAARTRRVGVVLVLTVAVVVSAGAIARVLTADLRLAQAMKEAAGVTEHEIRDVTAGIRSLPSSSVILLEGADASAAPKWTLPSLYFAVQRGNPRGVVFEPTGFAAQYLGLPADGDQITSPYFSPDYTHVLSAFPGIRTGRTTLRSYGPYVLERRAPIDVALVHTGWAHDPAEDERAIPWVAAPFDLRISTPRQERVALRIGLRSGQLLAGHPLVRLNHDGRTLATAESSDGSICAVIDVRAGFTTVNVVPLIPAPPAAYRPTESDPIPPPAKALGITRLEAQADQECS